MTYGHLQADCLYTGISSGPNARCRVWEAFTFFSLLHRPTAAANLPSHGEWKAESIQLFQARECFTFACSASSFYPDSYYEIYRVHVHYTGQVRWWFGGVMETSCHLDGTLFPFDSQTCSIVVESWAYSEAFLDLHNTSNYVHLDGFNDDGEPDF